MTTEQIQVREWMKVAEQKCPIIPTVPPEDVCELRLKLIAEELVELSRGIGYELEIDEKGNIVPFKDGQDTDFIEVCDALADLMVVVLGTAVAFGVDLEPVFQEVMKSNNTKLVNDNNGGRTVVKNHLGKILKPSSYVPPNLVPILDHQTANPLAS